MPTCYTVGEPIDINIMTQLDLAPTQPKKGELGAILPEHPDRH